MLGRFGLWLLAGIVVVATSCGGHRLSAPPPIIAPAPPPVSPREYERVIDDWLQSGRGIPADYSCAESVVTRSHLGRKPVGASAALALVLERHERKVCHPGNPLRLRVGLTDREVVETAGAPIPWGSGANCWSYRASKAGTAIDGVRVCFVSGIATRVGIAQHL